MQIEHHPPAARGVSSLMYVGDDEAVENAIVGYCTLEPSMMEIGVGVAGLALYVFGKGTARTIGGATAGWVALRQIARKFAR